MAAPTRVTCPECNKEQSLTILGRFRPHGPKEDRCQMSGLMIPGGLQLPPKEPDVSCNPSREMTSESSDVPDHATPATDTTCSESDTTPETSTPPTITPSSTATTIPGVEEYEAALAVAYVRPDKLNPAVTTPPNRSEFDLQLIARLKEMFYQYTNRTGRSAQKTLGPSQIGTPCDRRLLMHLMGRPPVNPGGDSWAAFVGTCLHAGLAEMFDWADAGQGRFVTELKVEFPNPLVPKGTLDVLDRVLYMVADHKAMGRWSLDMLKTKGIPPHYRVQLHVYGMGARLRGERVERVALIGWPRVMSSLDDLDVVSEPYDPGIARAALARVDALQARIDASPDHLALAKSADIADDCSYCPYHQKDAKDLKNGGCNGR